MRIITLEMDTGYLHPHAEALSELLRIVQGNPWVDLSAVREGPFGRAMQFVGHCFRLDQPTAKYYLSGWVDHCNAYLDRCGLLADVEGDALLAAVIAQSDVPYRLADFGRYGQPVELGIDMYVGRKTSNAWRLLKTTPLRAPSPSRYAVELPEGRPPIPRPKVFRDGMATEVATDGKPLWK